ncbi:ATP-binding cassette domain-containing protein [Arthrobacter sp. JZ12]|uniref:ATP-binding cassette domain-containing protein n=1 Tax=Arthrobacter sp. JZ12 TaxID=2654190 RepID=UPI002B48FEBB|nr:ATP-binding cassette domain-containing protein [Arthrobacter sp. JZ12]
MSLSVYPGELVSLKGFSDTAATALLNCLSGLGEPDGGSVFIGDRELTVMRESDRAELRQTHLGLVHGASGLLPILTVAENIELTLRLRGMPAAERHARVDELLELVGLAGCSHQPPSELPADQRWRVGIARAVANQPKVLLIHESEEGDSPASDELVNLLSDVVHDTQVAAIFSTSDLRLIERADRVFEMHNGHLQGPASGHVGKAVSPSNSQLGTSQMIEVPTEIANQSGRKA